MARTADDLRSVADAQAFARTYSHPVYDDPWDAVEDYRRVQAIATDYENPSPTAIADHLDLPRGRVKPWLYGSKPDCVRGIETARKHGWVNVDTDSSVFRGLNVLVAWIFSSGSITAANYSPYFVLDDHDDEPLLTAAADLADVDLHYTRSLGADRSAELRPVRDGSVLGRVCSVLGAPVGQKSAGSAIELPAYLTHVDERLAREFVQTYLLHRGEHQEGTDYRRFREERPAGYLESVGELIRRLTGEAVTVEGRTVNISAAAAREIGRWPPVLDVSPTP